MGLGGGGNIRDIEFSGVLTRKTLLSERNNKARQGEHGVCNQSMGCLVWANKVETICDVPREVWIEQEPLQANSLCGSGNAWRKRGLWAYKVETRLCDVYQAKSRSDKEPCRRNSVDQTQEFRGRLEIGWCILG